MADLAVVDVLLHDRRIGTLTNLPGERVLFAFDESYIGDAARPTLSLSFKDRFGQIIADIAPTRVRLPSFFSNLLPEGAMREYLARQAGVASEREFFLLWALGRDLPGALKIGGGGPPRPEDVKPRRRPAGNGDTLRFSLAGVQLKFSAVKEAGGGLTVPAEGVGGSWIVKLPSTVHAGVPENEFTMMKLARRIGIDVPETALVKLAKIAGLPEGVEIAGRNAFAIRRFDRGPAGAVHMEDFAQVFGVYPEQKYRKASYRSIAKVLWIETGENGVEEFVRRLVFTALIGNGDMHLKNWSLVYPDGRRAALSPAYDFVSTIAYIRNDALALNFTDSKEFASLTIDEFVRFAAKAGLPEKLTLDTARETVSRFREAWRKRGDLVPPPVEKAIAAHLKALPLWQS
ncbi:MAG: type II toxin-antitoxin system HipA family toxin [Alphaproteobacteria bacterium]|nr:type II toxin-antitoxin system HipA family toxin [Alphaproteobacteria bacterium]